MCGPPRRVARAGGRPFAGALRVSGNPIRGPCVQADVSERLPVPSLPVEPSGARLAAAARGDRAARAELLERYGPSLWALCRRLADDPEDAYQDAWERVLGVLDRFDPTGPASLKTWLHTVVHRALIDRHRRASARGTVIELADVVSPDPGPEGRLAAHRRAQALERALSELSDAHRRVVLMHHVAGQPLEAIAEAEGVALGTVKSRLHRARAELAARLEGER